MKPRNNRTSSEKMSCHSSEAIQYLFHHIFLPPHLPQNDSDSEYEPVLLDVTVDALKRFKDWATQDQHGLIDSIIGMVTSLRSIHESCDTGGAVSEVKFAEALRSLCADGKPLPRFFCTSVQSIDPSKVVRFRFTYALRMPVSSSVRSTAISKLKFSSSLPPTKRSLRLKADFNALFLVLPFLLTSAPSKNAIFKIQSPLHLLK